MGVVGELITSDCCRVVYTLTKRHSGPTVENSVRPRGKQDGHVYGLTPALPCAAFSIDSAVPDSPPVRHCIFVLVSHALNLVESRP